MLRKFIVFLASCFFSLCLGLLFVFIFVNATEVDCNRQPDNSYLCLIRTLLLGKIPTFSHSVEHVVDIKIESDSCDDGCSYRAEFVSADGNQTPLSEVYTDRGPVSEQVNALRPQLQGHVDQISYRADPPWWVLLLVGGLTAMSLLLSPLVFLSRR